MENICKCSHHKIIPACIVLIGLVFLAGQMDWLSTGFVNTVWPILLIIIGGTKIMGSKCKCC
ncbi:MAG: DUF5668 domain-containing protein [Patescibacteria group bacterium]